MRRPWGRVTLVTAVAFIWGLLGVVLASVAGLPPPADGTWPMVVGIAVAAALAWFVASFDQSR